MSELDFVLRHTAHLYWRHMKRLLDDQFDECGLTLQELQIIEDSLVKSLTAVYHGRVKYPEPRSA